MLRPILRCKIIPIITSRTSTRTRTMDQTTLTKLTGLAKSQGYDLSDLSLTVQP